MKTVQVVFLVWVLFVFTLICLALMVRRNGFQVRQRILAQDYSSLLTGCRTLIENRNVFTNDWPDRGSIQKSMIVLDSKIRPFNNAIPRVIRDLEPVYIAIDKDRVFVNTGTIPRNAILGFDTNAQQFGSVKLIDGLWLWTGRPEETAPCRR